MCNQGIEAEFKGTLIETNDFTWDLGLNLTHYKNSIELVELLPYHDMGKAKWHALGLEYKLEDTPAPAEETLAKAEEIFGRYGFGTLRTKR